MVFDDLDIVQFWIEGQKVELKDPTYNLFKELEGSFRTKLDGIYSEETRCGLKLDGEHLTGYIQYDQFSEEGYLRAPLFIQLKKE